MKLQVQNITSITAVVDKKLKFSLLCIRVANLRLSL